MNMRRRRNKDGFLGEYKLDPAYMQKPDNARGRPGVIAGYSADGTAVLIKEWIRNGSESDGDLEHIWRHELRQLHRLAGYPGAADCIAHLHDAGFDTKGFYLVIAPGQRQPLQSLLDYAGTDHWLKQPRSAGNRSRIWSNLKLLAFGLETLHSQGLLHRNLDSWAVLTAGSAEPDFQLTGFEWSMRIAGVEGKVRKTSTALALDSFVEDWKIFGLLAADLLAIKKERLLDAAIAPYEVAEHVSVEETKLLRGIVQVQPLAPLNGEKIAERIDDILRALAAEIASRHAKLHLAVRLGKAHEDGLIDAIKKARHRIVIHSTFISEDGFSFVKPHLHDAAKRGAIVDVLWGEDDDKTDSVTTAKTVARIREQIDATGMSSCIRVHPFSTRSHAKILIADDGRGTLSVVVGSCNWLSSNFQSYEASLRFSDPGVVAAVLEQIADLTRGYDRHWTELTSEMARLAGEARNQRIPAGLRAKVTLVLGPQHAQFVRLARDHATKRIFVTSHRLGAATRAAVFVPAITAVREKGLDVKAYYGTQSGNINTAGAAELTATAGKEGVQIRPVIEPRLHAKILAWDDNNLLITSQNWLSADPGESSMRREIGVLLQAQGVARLAIEDFEFSRHK